MLRPDAPTLTLDPARLAMVKGRPITCRVLAEGYRNAGQIELANVYEALALEAEQAQNKGAKP